MQMTTQFRPETLDHYLRRGRQLRSEAAIAIVASAAHHVIQIVERAFVRPYRMSRTPGCGCEA